MLLLHFAYPQTTKFNQIKNSDTSNVSIVMAVKIQ